MNKSQRMAHLLGECRREMNGAVVGSMRYYGSEYGLNYGVSLPTLRTLAQGEGCDHAYGRLLFQQQVRELQICSLWIADPKMIRSGEELDFWAKGIINSEIAEEAAFALLNQVDCIDKWLFEQDILLNYCSVLALSKKKMLDINPYKYRILQLASLDVMLLGSALVTLLEMSYRAPRNREVVDQIVKELDSNKTASFIKDELSWRLECCD